jgi:hypothetical protein
MCGTEVVSALDPVCQKGDLLCLWGRSLLLWHLPVSQEAPNSSAVCAVSDCLQSDTPPDLRALTEADVWGCHWRAKLWSSNRQSGNPLLCCEVFAV